MRESGAMDKETLYKQAIALEQKGKHSEALPIYSKLIVSSGDPRYFISYGVCLQKLGHWEQSLKPLLKGVSLKPHYCEGDARLFLAETFIKLGKKGKAVEQWKARRPHASVRHVRVVVRRKICVSGSQRGDFCGPNRVSPSIWRGNPTLTISDRRLAEPSPSSRPALRYGQ